MFLRLRDEITKAGVYNGPQIRKLIKDPKFMKPMTEIEAHAWDAFENGVTKFLGNRRDDGYKNLVDDLT